MLFRSPKFFLFDLGIRHAAAGLKPSRETVLTNPGPFFEQWVGIELWKRLQYLGEGRLLYLRTRDGMEIDFVIETRKRQSGTKPSIVCVEVKSSERWDPSWNRPMLELAASGGVRADGLYGVYRGDRRLHFYGIHVLPVRDFLSALHAGKVF